MKKATILTAVLVAISAGLLVAAETGGDDAIVAMEKKAWQSYKDRQAEGFKSLMGSPYTAVYAEGMKDINGELADMSKVELRSFELTDTKVTHPTPDVAVLAYTCNAQGSYAGSDISGTYNCGSVYAKQDGKWVGVFHTEVKAMK